MQNPIFKKILMTFVSLVLVFSSFVYQNTDTVQAQGRTYFYVATSGSSSGNGTLERPWDLQTALNQPGEVKPGAVIYLRHGEYKGKFTLRADGASGRPITIAPFPGERATLKNSSGPAIDISDSSYVNFWGLEISGPVATRKTSRSESTYGVRVNQGDSSDHINFINMVFHDVQAQGIGWWQALKNSMIYGSVFYYNGTTELDHGVYAHSSGSGTKAFMDNIVFNNASHGFHGYAETSEKGLNNFYIAGNTFFNNGSIGYNTRKDKYGTLSRNILVGGLTRAKNPVITDNYTYHSGSAGTSLNLGYKGGSDGAVIERNIFMGGEFTFGSNNTNVTMRNNYVFAPGGINGVTTSKFASNSWFSSKPNLVTAIVRRNLYEANRANITIYNFAKHTHIWIPASSLAGIKLTVGKKYYLYNVQNFYGDVIVGTYDGQGIAVPMTNRSVAQPYGLDFKPASTFPEFGAFILFGS